MKNFIDTITSKAYWQFVLLSRSGLRSVFAILGGVYLVVEILDFFKIYTRSEYGAWAFVAFMILSIVLAVSFKRPIKSVSVTLPGRDGSIEVRIGDIFDASGAVMVSTNTVFEADVAGGKIATDSLQGQFTARYFTGNQNELIAAICEELKLIEGHGPYPVGTTVPVTTHGKTFYLTAMARLNDKGNAETTLYEIKEALDGLWAHVRESGELQELVVPVIGTGRGRLGTSRRKMIGVIVESYVKATASSKIADKLVVVVRPSDAERFSVNLYDIKDYIKYLV